MVGYCWSAEIANAYKNTKNNISADILIEVRAFVAKLKLTFLSMESYSTWIKFQSYNVWSYFKHNKQIY